MHTDLPDYPWDTLADVRARAAAHPGGLVDLSVGTPVDPTPESVQQALADSADAPGYPFVHGTADLRAAIADWYDTRRHSPGVDPAGVLPTIGSKELVGLLPSLLGLGAGDTVAFPAVAYPTYEVGARVAGATALPVGSVDELVGLGVRPGTPAPRLVWLNTPGNPTGEILSVTELRRVVEWAREHGALVASDECYARLDWRPDAEPTGTPSILDDRVCGGNHTGLLSVYSLSKQSNLAGYRAAFAAGDPALVARLVAIRKHLGLIVPRPVQRATIAALADEGSVFAQRERYAVRRATLLAALTDYGFRVDHSQAGLYLWATLGADSTTTLDRLAGLGILAGPGHFYGAAGARHVRIALTAPDDRVAEAAERLRRAHRVGDGDPASLG